MICKVLDNNNYLIKVFKEYYDFDIYDHNEISVFIQKLFNKLLKKYDITGNMLLNIYIDNIYGLIIEMKKDNDFNLDDLIDIKIRFNLNISFLYEIDYFYLKELNITNQNIYYYNNKFYLEIINDISYEKYLKILDNSIIIYNNKINEIIDNGIKINL